MGFRILEWISRFQVGFLDFRMDFRTSDWILDWISCGFLEDFWRISGGFLVDFWWISGFQFGFLPTMCEILL